MIHGIKTFCHNGSHLTSPQTFLAEELNVVDVHVLYTRQPEHEVLLKEIHNLRGEMSHLLEPLD